MSTIAFKDSVIASETMAVCFDEHYENIEKVGRTENYLFGFAGRLGYMRPTYQWVNRLDKKGVHPQDFYKYGDKLQIECDGSAIIVDRYGQVWCIELDGHVHPIGRQYAAIGSGGSYALGAMAFGATAAESVEVASKLDVNSGGRIMTCSFDDPVSCPNEKRY